MTADGPGGENREILGGWVDPESGATYFLDRGMVAHQIRTTSVEIVNSFDALCHDDVRQISALCVEALLYCTPGTNHAFATGDPLGQTNGQLLQNAVTAVTGSLTVARAGFRLEPGMIMRSTIEMVAVVFHLAQHPNDLGRVRAGQFDSAIALRAAKKALPPFGQTYGLFSKQFTHVGALHTTLQPVTPYEEDDEALKVNMLGIKLTCWLIYAATELVFNQMVDTPRYWHPIGQRGYAYNPSPSEQEWFSEFFGEAR